MPYWTASGSFQTGPVASREHQGLACAEEDQTGSMLQGTWALHIQTLVSHFSMRVAGAFVIL